MSQQPEFPILNPGTPLVYLPPSIASQLETSRYLFCAVLGAFVWDIFVSGKMEYTMLFRSKPSIPTTVYFLARISALAYLGTSITFQLGPVGNCQALQVALGWAYVVEISSTSALFYLRVRAIMKNNKWVVAFYTALWLANCGTTLTVPFAIQGEHIGPTNRCVNSSVKSFVSSTFIVSAIHDTLVFIGISWKLLSMTHIPGDDKTGWFLAGKGLPRISKSILQGGQQYYLLTIGGNILLMVLLLTPSVPPILRAMFTFPNNALETAMACKVFRDIKFGFIDPTGATTLLPVSQRTAINTDPPRFGRNPRAKDFRMRNESDTFQLTSFSRTDNFDTDQVKIEISQDSSSATAPAM